MDVRAKGISQKSQLICFISQKQLHFISFEPKESGADFFLSVILLSMKVAIIVDICQRKNLLFFVAKKCFREAEDPFS